MKIKTYIPFLSVPVASVWLVTKAYDVYTGRMQVPHDTTGLIVFGVVTCVWAAFMFWELVSGVIKLHHPYITTDEHSIQVFGNSFDNRKSDELCWADVASLQPRTFSSLVVLMRDGQTKMIPLNGMSPAALREFAALIKEMTKPLV